MTVSRQELFNAERSGAMVRTDQHDISEPMRDQLHSAQNEGPHDELAEFAVGLHERQQVFAIQLDHFARLTDARSEQRRATRKHVDLAGELTRSIDYDERLAGAGWPDNLDPTCRNHEERHDLRPASTSTSPARIKRTRPCAAIRLS